MYSKKSQPEKFGKNLFSDVLTFYTIRTTALFYYLNNFMTDSVLFLVLECEGGGALNFSNTFSTFMIISIPPACLGNVYYSVYLTTPSLKPSTIDSRLAHVQIAKIRARLTT